MDHFHRGLPSKRSAAAPTALYRPRPNNSSLVQELPAAVAAYGEEGYGAAALDYSTAPAVMDADYSMPTEGVAGFEAVTGPQAAIEYAAPATDFAAGY
jgi:hypothetical protein